MLFKGSMPFVLQSMVIKKRKQPDNFSRIFIKSRYSVGNQGPKRNYIMKGTGYKIKSPVVFLFSQLTKQSKFTPYCFIIID